MPSQEERRRQQQLDFLARLKRAVRASGLNQKELAKRLGVAESSVTGWLRHNAMPGADILFELPYVLNVSADWLLAGRGSREPPKGDPAGMASDEALAAIGEMELALNDIRTRWEGKQATARGDAAREARRSSDAAASVRRRPGRQKGAQG